MAPPMLRPLTPNSVCPPTNPMQASQLRSCRGHIQGGAPRAHCRTIHKGQGVPGLACPLQRQSAPRDQPALRGSQFPRAPRPLRAPRVPRASFSRLFDRSFQAPSSPAIPAPAPDPTGDGAVPGAASVAELAAQEDEIIAEQFTRNEQMLGREGQIAVHSAFVVVVGLGGVGSHAATMLLRSGVGRLRLVDFDQVSLSSLNRHAVAAREDVGTPKAECMRRHLLRILPEAHIEAVVGMYSDATEESVLAGDPDYVLDCIDNIDTKVALLWACKRRGLRVLSSMGSGTRADPTRIRVGDVMETSIDPLSRAVRLRLRKLVQQEQQQQQQQEQQLQQELQEQGEQEHATEPQNGASTQEHPVSEASSSSGASVTPEGAPLTGDSHEGCESGGGLAGQHRHRGKGKDKAKGGAAQGQRGAQRADAPEAFLGIESVFSLERPKNKLLPLSETEGDPLDFQVVPGFRVRVIPVLGTIPAIFGQVMATHVLTRLASLDVQTEPVVSLSADHYRLLHQRLVDREFARFGTAEAVEVDVDDVVFVAREVWRGRSARRQDESEGVLAGRAMWRSMTNMTLTRWDASKPPTVDNLVLLTFDEADEHDQTSLSRIAEEEPSYHRFVSTRLQRALHWY